MVTNKDIAVAIINDYKYTHDELQELEGLVELLIKKRNTLSTRLEEIRTRERALIDKIKHETGKEFSLFEFMQTIND